MRADVVIIDYQKLETNVTKKEMHPIHMASISYFLLKKKKNDYFYLTMSHYK
jgi:hypothetical protein